MYSCSGARVIQSPYVCSHRCSGYVEPDVVIALEVQESPAHGWLSVGRTGHCLLKRAKAYELLFAQSGSLGHLIRILQKSFRFRTFQLWNLSPSANCALLYF